MNGVLLDTSFLITLVDRTRPNHAVAMRYFKECARQQIPMYLSAIVISEFQVKQGINDLPMRHFVVLPFNIDHAMRCGLLTRQLQRDAGDDRVRVKDDVKLIAQCYCEGISHLLSEDGSTLVKYLQRLMPDGATPGTRAIVLNGGFDASWFENGQYRLPEAP